MAKEIDLSGIAAGVGQANRARQKYLEDAFEDERNERLGAAFVKPFIEETVFDGPERRRKERLEIQMRDPNLTKKINDAKADLIKTRSETLKSTFDRIENNPNGLEAGAREIATEMISNTEVGKLISGINVPNSPRFTFVSDTLKNNMQNLYKERIDKQAELVLKTHNEIKDSGILKDYDIGNAYRMSQANYDKLSAGVSLDVESSDIFRQGVNKLFGDDDAADVANLYNQANMIQNKIDKFYNDSEKFVKLSSTTVKFDDKLEGFVQSVNNLKEEDFKKFNGDSLTAFNNLNTDDENERYKGVFTTEEGILSQWNSGLKDDNGNYSVSNLSKGKGSTTVQNPFGIVKDNDYIPFNDISAVSEDKIEYRKRTIVDGKLVEKDIINPGGQQNIRDFLGGMVTNLASTLKFEAERTGAKRVGAANDINYLNSAYRLLAKNGYIRMKNANDIEQGLILVQPLSNSTSGIVSSSANLSVEDRKELGIDNLYNMSVNRRIQDAKESGGGTDEDFVPSIITDAEKDLEEEIDNTQDVEKREQLFAELDDINNAKLSNPNEARRQVLKQLIAPTKSNLGKSYVYDEDSGLTYTAGQLTKENAESIYKQLLIQNGVDSDPEIRGLIDVARFKGDNNSNSIDSQMTDIRDMRRNLRRPDLLTPTITALSNFSDRQQKSSDFKKLQNYADGTRTFDTPRQLEKLFTKYNLGQNPTQEKVQEFLKDNS
tara:strand:+ start:2113 stop:4263 length:2151 start_codon:yes stop_codon:yes gene_type:complete